MSKEVKRYELRIVDRYAGDGTGDIETDARMKQEVNGRYVLFSDYDTLRGLYKMHQETETREMRDLKAERDALLAERDALKALLVSSREFVAAYVNSSFFGPNARKQLEAIDAAMQGEQP